MTRDEAIMVLKNEQPHCGKKALFPEEKKYEAYDVAIKALEQEPKTGHWREDIDNSRKWDRVRFYCSECGKWQTYGKTGFCPNCGVKMEESEE